MDFFKKYAVVAVTASSILLALIFYSLNIPHNREANVVEKVILAVFQPILKPVAETSGFFKDIWNGYINLVGTHQENLRLRDDIHKLNARISAGNEVFQENKNLRRLLQMQETIKDPAVAASVIGEDLSSWFRTLVIDRGASSGLREGMAVIAAEGVVGQIVKVSNSTSRVLLITDHASGVAATIQRSRARGVVKGKGDGLCSLEFTTREEDVKIGDVVVSSGIGGIFLKGLPIGEVTMVKRGEYGIFQTVSIRPAVNMEHLEEVLVVLRGGYE